MIHKNLFQQYGVIFGYRFVAVMALLDEVVILQGVHENMLVT